MTNQSQVHKIAQHSSQQQALLWMTQIGWTVLGLSYTILKRKKHSQSYPASLVGAPEKLLISLMFLTPSALESNESARFRQIPL
jgi:hypothetical protein